MMARVTLRNLAAHKIRLVLTAVAVILGVAFVAGTLIFTDSMNRQFDSMFSRIGQDVAVNVRATDVGGGGRPVPAGVVESLQEVDGVENVVGNVSGFAAVLGRDGEIAGPPAGQGPPKLGVNWADDTAGFEMTSGRAPRGPAELSLDTTTAKDAGFGVGDTVRVVTSGPAQEMKVVGLFEAGDMMGASIIAFDTATAQKLLLQPGYFNDVQMESAGPSEAELRDRVAAVLPDGFEAVTGEQMREETKSDVAQIMGFFRTFLLVFALISVFVGAFIIFNTFSMLVAQRTRELALLRAIGAARPQVTRAVLGEAVAIGAVGSTLGLGAGAGLAWVLQGAAGMDTSALAVTPTAVFWSYAVGIVVTVVSAYFPARRAAKIPPVAAMRDDVALPQRSLRIRVALGSLLTAAGAALAAAGLAGSGNAVALVGGGAFAVFIGVTMLAPVISVPVVTVLGAPFARLLGAPGRLARRNALRNPRRTAATAAALMIGLALITVVNVLGSTMRASVDEQVEEQFGADYIVQAAGGAMAGASVGAGVAEEIAAVPGVAAASPVYGGRAEIGGKEVRYVAADAAGVADGVRLEMVSGKAGFGADGILVSEENAAEHGWKVGSPVPVRFPDGESARLRVTGVYAENAMVGGQIVDPRLYMEHTVRPTIDVVLVDAANADGSTTAAIEDALAAHPTLEVSDRAALKDEAREQVDMLVTMLTTLLMMSVIIAAVGVVNTLALSVIERTREIGLLRAIGISRRQLRRMIRVESIVIAVFGAVLGIGIGVAFGAALQNALADQGLTVLSVPVATLVVYLVVAALIGVLAALWPAWRAGRMDVLKAISTE